MGDEIYIIDLEGNYALLLCKQIWVEVNELEFM